MENWQNKLSLDQLAVINQIGIDSGGYRGGAEAVVMAVITAMRDGAGDTISVSSTYGAKTKRPFVAVTWGEQVAQLPPDSARQLAIDILESAEASISDAFLMEWLAERVGVSDQNMRGAMLMELRKFRQEYVFKESPKNKEK